MPSTSAAGHPHASAAGSAMPLTFSPVPVAMPMGGSMPAGSMPGGAVPLMLHSANGNGVAQLFIAQPTGISLPVQGGAVPGPALLEGLQQAGMGAVSGALLLPAYRAWALMKKRSVGTRKARLRAQTNLRPHGRVICCKCAGGGTCGASFWPRPLQGFDPHVGWLTALHACRMTLVSRWMAAWRPSRPGITTWRTTRT